MSATSEDPLHGNHASDLLGAALPPTQPVSDPSAWQPPSPEFLQAMLPGYYVEGFLARGGMGAVYRGVQVSLSRRVAIKILPPKLAEADANFAERFKQEARAMAQLNHPGIVSVYDFGEMQDGTLYFIMEFVDGTDVSQMVAQQGRLPSAHAMAITAHVCDALQYAHERGVVHRDIKPANIIVGYDGSVKVADFGLAKSALHANTSLTVSGHVMGTPHFVAPEALTLGSSVDHRADIYAVGVMLYQMLTGKLPQGVFEMPSMQVPGLDPRYDAIVAAAMRENRDQRYQHIHDMRRALDAIVTQPVAKTEVAGATPAPQRTAGGPPPQQKPRAPGQPQRKVAAPAPHQKASSAGWAAFFVVLLALAGGAFWLFRSPATQGKAQGNGVASPSNPPASAPSNATTNPDAANLLINGSFESKDLSQWRLQGHREDKEAGSFEPNAGRNNSTAAVLRSEEINDIRFMQTVKVTPNTDYVVSGWLKTQGVVQEDGKLRGAGLSVLGGFEGTKPIGGDNDWTLVQFTFNSKERTEVEICARLGFFGAAAKGTIWFDDLRMERAGVVPSTREKPFINSLGMKFVPVPGTKVLMCIHPTRVKDYQSFAVEHSTGNTDWQHPKDKRREYPASPDHAVTMVNWFEAQAFCDWLSKKEGLSYRLPSNEDWRAAAAGTLRSPPPSDELHGYSVHPRPPVMNWKPNTLGIHDLGLMGGEWCADSHPKWKDLKLQNRFIVERAGGTSATDLMVTLPPHGSDELDADGPDNRRPYAVFRCVVDLEPPPSVSTALSPPNSSLQTDPYANPPPLSAAPPTQEDYSVLAVVTIYGVAREEAAGYLGQTRLKSDPAYFAKRLADSASAGFAHVVSNLAVSSRFGEDSKVKSQYSVEFSIMGKSSEPILNLDLSSLHAPSGSRLKALDRPVKRGETIYLGSFDEETADPTRPVRIAFLTFR